MTDDCMGCRVPGYSHAAYCPEGRVEDLRSRLASVERERDEIMAMAERREGELQARLAEAEALLKEARPWVCWCRDMIRRTDDPEDVKLHADATLASIDAFLAADSATHRENERG